MLLLVTVWRKREVKATTVSVNRGWWGVVGGAGVREWRCTSVTTSTRCETHKPLSRWLTPELQWQRLTSWWKQREDDRDEGIVGRSSTVCVCMRVRD